MGIKKINEWEKAVVFLLNLDGWELEHCGDGYSRYDAKGKTTWRNFILKQALKFNIKNEGTIKYEKGKWTVSGWEFGANQEAYSISAVEYILRYLLSKVEGNITECNPEEVKE